MLITTYDNKDSEKVMYEEVSNIVSITMPPTGWNNARSLVIYKCRFDGKEYYRGLFEIKSDFYEGRKIIRNSIIITQK